MAVPQLPQLQDAEFDPVVRAEQTPVVVEFYSPLCPPCRRIAPIVVEIAREYAGRLRFVQVNAMQSPDLTRRFRVAGVPTMVILSRGQGIGRIVGEMPRETLTARLDEALARVPQA